MFIRLKFRKIFKHRKAHTTKDKHTIAKKHGARRLNMKTNHEMFKMTVCFTACADSIETKTFFVFKKDKREKLHKDVVWRIASSDGLARSMLNFGDESDVIRIILLYY